MNQVPAPPNLPNVSEEIWAWKERATHTHSPSSPPGPPGYSSRLGTGWQRSLPYEFPPNSFPQLRPALTFQTGIWEEGGSKGREHMPVSLASSKHKSNFQHHIFPQAQLVWPGDPQLPGLNSVITPQTCISRPSALRATQLSLKTETTTMGLSSGRLCLISQQSLARLTPQQSESPRTCPPLAFRAHVHGMPGPSCCRTSVLK